LQFIDKTLHFDGGSIGWLFLLVKVYYGTEKQGLAMRLVMGGGSAAAFLRNQLPVTRQEGIFEQNSDNPHILRLKLASLRKQHY
jgi:hypothetical protein